MKHSNHQIMSLKKGILYLSMMVIPLAMSCGQADREHRDNQAHAVDSNADETAKAQVSTADVNMDGGEKAFITSAYSQSLYAQELANSVMKSNNADVRSLAKTVVADQTKLIQDLEQIAKGKGLQLQRALSDSQQKELDALKELATPTLEEQFLQKLQALQAGATVIYEEGKNLNSTTVNDYATNAIKVVQARQATTAKLVKAVISTNSQGTRPGEVATQN